MSAVSASKRAALLAILVVSSAGAAGAQLADRPLFVEARVPKPPTVATGSMGSFLVYEVVVTSLQPVGMLRWTRLDVLNGSADGPVLQSLADSALWRDMLRPGLANVSLLDRPNLTGSQRALVFLRVPVPEGTRVTSLVHRLTMTDSTGARTLVMRPVPVTPEAIVIGPPLRGTNWFAANGPGNTSGHRRTHIPIDGHPGIAQRFAIDWVQMDSTFATFTGDRLKNESYYAEDEDALAVLDGTVVATKDSIPENVPGVNSRAVPITLETVGGNHVILDIGRGHYAFYAHLRPGSLRVKVGDRVKKGQVVGKVGNSGNSTEPHLHFHIADHNSPLGAEGLPYVIESLDLVGSCRGFGQNCAFRAAETKRRVMPLDAEIIRFPR